VRSPASEPELLQAVLNRALGRATGVPVNLQRLSAGATSSIWSFDLPGRRPIGHILRIAAPGTNRVPVSVEAAAMQAAREAGVPVPPVLYSTDNTEPFDAPYMIMERVEGESIARHILREPEFEPARKAFASQCGSILGRLSRTGVEAVPGLQEGGQLELWAEILHHLEVPVPTFEWALRYLERERPAEDPGRRGVVHGDFRLGNMILGGAGVRAVLDWELVHVGDPLEDLGWLCARPWRFRGPKPVGGMGDYDDLLGAYHAECGLEVDRDELRWWEVFATLRWGIICLLQASRHLNGTDRSVELATIGRRVAETELDLLDCVP